MQYRDRDKFPLHMVTGRIPPAEREEEDEEVANDHSEGDGGDKNADAESAVIISGKNIKPPQPNPFFPESEYMKEKLSVETRENLFSRLERGGKVSLKNILSGQSDGTFRTESGFLGDMRHFVHTNSAAQCDFTCSIYFSCMGWTLVVIPGDEKIVSEQLWEPREYYAEMRRRERQLQKSSSLKVQAAGGEADEEDPFSHDNVLNYTEKLHSELLRHKGVDALKLHGENLDFQWTNPGDGSLDDSEMARKLLLFPQKGTGLRCFLRQDSPKGIGAVRMWESRYDLRLQEYAPKTELSGDLVPGALPEFATTTTAGPPTSRRKVGLWQELVDLVKALETNLGQASSNKKQGLDVTEVPGGFPPREKYYYFSALRLVSMPFQYIHLPVAQVHSYHVTAYAQPLKPRREHVIFERCYRARPQSPFTPSYLGNVTLRVDGSEARKTLLMRECDEVRKDRLVYLRHHGKI
eukprot:g14354.t1